MQTTVPANAAVMGDTFGPNTCLSDVLAHRLCCPWVTDHECHVRAEPTDG